MSYVGLKVFFNQDLRVMLMVYRTKNNSVHLNVKKIVLNISVISLKHNFSQTEVKVILCWTFSAAGSYTSGVLGSI